jgi:hypothetical protein
MESSFPPLGCHVARCLQACETYPVHLVGRAMWHWLELWLEFVDARLAALEGGTALMALRRAMWQWWWSLSSVIRMAWRKLWGILVLAVL